MSKEKFEAFLDYGSSKIRIGVFDNEYPKNIYYIDDKCNTNFSLKKFSLGNSDDKIVKLIKSLEKKTNTYLSKISIMLDTPDFVIINIASKKKFEGRSVDLNDMKYLLQELNLLIKNGYPNLKIIHLIVTKIIIDKKEYLNFPDDNINCNELILEVMFICLPNIIAEQLIEQFKKKFISIKKIYCSSYLKSFSFKEFFKNYDKKFFLDIGYEKSTLSIYSKNKLIFIKFLPLGGNNITKDISKVLKISDSESEYLKENFYKSKMNLLSNTNEINKFESTDILKKIIFSRLDEIIDLIFKKINIDNVADKKEKSILVFTGEGSKILEKKSVFLSENFEYFSEINFIEENTLMICESGRKFNILENPNEINIVAKKQRKFGFFEKIFNLLK